jgi:hypothetical protein
MPSNLSFFGNISIQSPLAVLKTTRTHLRQPRNSNRHFARLENTRNSFNLKANCDF